MKLNIEKTQLKDWLATLSEASKGERYANLWKRVYRLSAVPARRRHSVNLYKVNENTEEGANVIVPGKVLSIGPMDHKVTISAIEFSAQALAALKEANCKIVPLREMTKAQKVQVII
ncbi:MAG: 50S ribosomal protein L18e [Candidatus Micrarchaeota archaeon]|nr:50S ribosomal protein L18e [Candidatus Micrarchaeota archaeon]